MCQGLLHQSASIDQYSLYVSGYALALFNFIDIVIMCSMFYLLDFRNYLDSASIILKAKELLHESQ